MQRQLAEPQRPKRNPLAMSKPPHRPNYDRKLARPITLADGTAIVTLRDAARVIRERFVVTAWPLLELAIKQLMTAAATGDAADIAETTDTLERLFRARRLL